jgi:hypothetical protein
MATFSRNTRLFLTAATTVILLSACAGRGKGPLLLHPIPPQSEGYTLNSGALEYEVPGMKVTARPLDWRLVEKNYRERGQVSPFGEEEGAFSHFVFFSLLLENSSDQKIDFSTFRVILYSKIADLTTPLDLSDIYYMSRGAPDLQERALSFQKTCFDGPTVVYPDSSEERYLVFATPPGKARKLTLSLSDIYLGLDSYDVKFLFEAFSIEEEEK